MDKQFRCIKQLVVDQYDEHEMPLENESFIVPVESVWMLRDHAYLSEVRLESSEFGWLEIDSDSLKEYFVEI